MGYPTVGAYGTLAVVTLVTGTAAVSDGGCVGRVTITFGWTRLDELLLGIFLRGVGAFSRGDLEV